MGTQCQCAGQAGIATLIRNTQQKDAFRAKKDALLQASPEKIKKQQEDADRAMKELLEEEENEQAAAAAGSQKKAQAKAGKSEKKKNYWKCCSSSSSDTTPLVAFNRSSAGSGRREVAGKGVASQFPLHGCCRGDEGGWNMGGL